MKHAHKSGAIRYAVISPVRDEAKHLEETIRSMVHQTIRPVQWILVNDGSTDGTAEIIDRWAKQYSWIVPVHCQDRGKRVAGTGVIEAFYQGFEKLAVQNWSYLVKLDGDLSFEDTYFEKCFAEFEADPTLGIGGGVICHQIGHELVVEPNPVFHVRGATKIYRRECWEALGGVLRAPGWDTVDEVKANMLGWTTRSFASLKLLHHRFTGAAAGGWKNAVKNGMGSYICGYHPLFMLFKCVKNIPQKPYITGSIGLMYGFILGYLQKPLQVEKPVADYLREQQLRRLSLRNTIWK